MKRCPYILAYALLSLGPITASRLHAFPSWPDATVAWSPLKTDTGFYSDPDDYSPSHSDIRGDADTYSAGYWYFDGQTLFFRMRVDSSPRNCTSVWTWLLDTDGNDDVDWGLDIDMSGTPGYAELVQAATGGPTIGDIEFTVPANIEDFPWYGTTSQDDPSQSWARCVSPSGDGSSFDGDPDAFADVAIPWADFASNTGATKDTPIRIGLATSGNTNNINKDRPMGLSDTSSVADIWSQPIVVPEPSTFILLTVLAYPLFLRRRPGQHRP